MNNSVAVYTPKTRNFSGTMSLQTRVGVTAGVLSLDYLGFWTCAFHDLGLEMDDEFIATLVARDTKKEKERKIQETIKGKTKWRKVYNTKNGQTHIK